MQHARKYGEFERRHAQVVGISVDSVDRIAAMVEKLLLPFPLLGDSDGAVSRAYDVWGPESKISIPVRSKAMG